MNNNIYFQVQDFVNNKILIVDYKGEVYYLNNNNNYQNLKKKEYYKAEIDSQYGKTLNLNKIQKITKKEFSLYFLSMSEKFIKNKDLINKIEIKLLNKTFKNKLLQNLFDKLVKEKLPELKYYPASIFQNFNYPGGLLIKNNIFYDLMIKNYKTFKNEFNILNKNLNKEIIFFLAFTTNIEVDYQNPILKEINTLGKLIEPIDMLKLKIINEYKIYQSKLDKELEENKNFFLVQQNEIRKLKENLEKYVKNKNIKIKEINNKIIELRKQYKIEKDNEKKENIIKEGEALKQKAEEIKNKVNKYIEQKEKYIKEYEKIQKQINKKIKQIEKELKENIEICGNIIHSLKELNSNNPKPRTIEANIFISTYEYLNKNATFLEEIEKVKKNDNKFSNKLNYFLYI